MSLDRTRAEISAIIGEIEKVDPEIRLAASDPNDWEAYEIIRRIERRLRGLPVMTPEEAR